MKRLLAALMLGSLAGCAAGCAAGGAARGAAGEGQSSIDDVREFGVYDPYERTNRKVHDVVDRVDRHTLSPLARGYRRVTPNWLERGVSNVFLNMRTVPSAINGFLQGKPGAGMTDLARVVINSTIGIGGFFDVATHMDLRYQEEDFGQTLAVWGVTRSRYIYVPFLGPSTLRDLPSTLVRSYIPRLILGNEYHWSVSVVDAISTRASLLNATDVRDASALDPYAFTRDAYYQRRKFLVYDGRPPLEDLFDEFEAFDDPSDE